MTTTLTKPDPLAGVACPSWCTLPTGHGVDSVHADYRGSRDHRGPDFGPSMTALEAVILTGCAREFTDAPGVLSYAVYLDAEPVTINKPSNLLNLAEQAIAAAQWLEAHR